MAASAQHSSVSKEHYTPLPIIEAARTALGRIDLDPASSARVNEDVRAKTFYMKENDGLKQRWEGRTFLNPPGGPVYGSKITRSRAALWWAKLAVEWRRGSIEAAIFVAFSIELFQSAQNISCPQPLDFPFCIPSERLHFDKIVDGERVEQKDPTHANAIILLPPRSSALDGYKSAEVKRFKKAFTPFGKVRM